MQSSTGKQEKPFLYDWTMKDEKYPIQDKPKPLTKKTSTGDFTGLTTRKPDQD